MEGFQPPPRSSLLSQSCVSAVAWTLSLVRDQWIFIDRETDFEDLCLQAIRMLAFGAQDCTKYKHITFDDFVELCNTVFVSQYSQGLMSQLNGLGHMNPIYHKEEKDMKERAITIQLLLLFFVLFFSFQ